MSEIMKPFQWPVRVYYEDTDAGGVVFYANYLRFLERARTEWLRSFDFEQDQLRSEYGIVFAVRSVDIKYLKPARFNEQLTVSVENIQLKQASMAMQQSVSKLDIDKNELIVKATVNVVCLHNEQFSPCPIPKPIFEVLKACM
jgi:acyl-CoA thioester hydrolase